MASICAAPCHIWSHLSPLVCWSHVSHVFMSEYPNICILPYLSLKPGKSPFPIIHFVWEATLMRRYFSPGSRISQEVAFPGSPISKEVTFPRKSHFPRSHISWEVKFPGKSYFLGSHIFREVVFSGKLYFLVK